MATSAQASHSPTNGHIQGNVDMAAGVAMASGVLLGAAPGCRLVISPGVCLGADAIIQACQGDLVLEPGVSLGSGVLIIGHGFIGQHTCIGANSTIINPAVGASQVIAPGSLLGDPSQASSARATAEHGSVSGDRDRLDNGNSSHGTGTQNDHISNGSTPNGSAAYGNFQNGNTSNGSTVYGKSQVNRLLATLFPHRQALNGATPEDRP